MTLPDVPLRPYEEYLFTDPGEQSAAGKEESARLSENLLGPDQSLDLFAMVAALAARRRAAALRRMHAHYTALHEAIERADGSLPALRALAALGLALAEDDPDSDLLRAALAWHKQARGTPAGVAAPWAPAALAGGDLPLLRCLECLAEVAGADRDSLATLTVAAALRRLRQPTAEPRADILLIDPGPAPGGPEPARRWLRGRVPGPARRPKRHVITALLDQGRSGTAARLTLTVDGGLPAGLIPDPERMSLFAADESFQEALGRAWRQAGQGRIRRLVTWSAITSEGPLRYAGGESASAAFAVIFDEARRFARPLAALTVIHRVVSGNAVTGRIDDLGFLQGVEGYEAKLDALGEGSRVIVPAADEEKAIKARKDIGIEIVPVTHWTEAARKARRPAKKVMLGQGLAAALVAALIATGMASAIAYGEHEAAVQKAARAAYSQAIAEGSQQAPGNPQLAAQLDLAAYRMQPSPALAARLIATQNAPLYSPLPAAVGSVAFSPAADVFATARGSIRLWEATGAGRARPLGGPFGSVPAGSIGGRPTTSRARCRPWRSARPAACSRSAEASACAERSSCGG